MTDPDTEKNNEKRNTEQADETASAPIIKRKSTISAIWALPIIAILIALSLVYEAWQNSGVNIAISFENAKGLEVKKTRVKYKDVNIGLVESIQFSEDDERVIANVSIDREMERFLRSDSQFWVVRPRIGSSGISGVSTLLSGAYIAMEPGKNNQTSTQFEGLETPPISNPNDDGLKLTLTSNGGKALRVGNPVIYRGFDVGAVEAVDFDVETGEISYEVFITAPYHKLVTTNSFFWNAGGFEVSTGLEGLSVDFSSIESFIAGGVQFDVPEDLSMGQRVTESRSFKLYPNKTSVTEDREYEYLEFALLISGSVAGVTAGTPVEYRGIRIGRVATPYLGFHQTQQINPGEERIPVIIHIEPKRLTQDASYGMEWFQNQFELWIEDGLAATIESANYLTGAMKVSLDMSLEGGSEVTTFGRYTLIPVGASGFDGILEQTDKLLSKLNELDLDAIIAALNDTMTVAQQSMKQADETVKATKEMVDNISRTMTEAQKALRGMQPGSPAYEALESNLIKLQETLDSLQPFIEKVSAKPNTIIFSEDAVADPEPEGKKP
ncbi:intermembrane transport protein PqiB [Ningiella sp. W23]|uniref:intermembrane transport protein PqiB n=1 Tax=Ningiella sp. W23 TaxID=3023715 RepID=UPI003757FC27